METKTNKTDAPEPHRVSVLFMDIVGYGKLLMNAQSGVQMELQAIVQHTQAVQQAKEKQGGLIIRPTGDGMALVFFHDLLAPVQCAIEIANVLAAQTDAIKARTGATLKLRMGIHTGSVFLVEDLNQLPDVAGDGIVTAQRVMDCGDAGHILLSDKAAEAIEKRDPWARWLMPIGKCRVKHDAWVFIYNLSGRTLGASANFGNLSTPSKVFADTLARRDAHISRETRRKRREAEEGIAPYVRSLIMLACAAGLIGSFGAALWLNYPETFRQWARYANKTNFLGPPKEAKAATPPPAPRGANPFSVFPNPTPAPITESGKPKTVRLFSASPLPLIVPDLSHQSLTQAKALAQNAGFRIRESKNSDYSTDVEKGLIYKQNPLPGAIYTRGEIVRVRISKGLPALGADAAPTPAPDVWAAPEPAVRAAPPVLAVPAYSAIVIDASHLPTATGRQEMTVIGGGETLYPDSDAETNELLLHFCKSVADAKAHGAGNRVLFLRAESVTADGSVRLSETQTKMWQAASEGLNLSQSHQVYVIVAH